MKRIEKILPSLACIPKRLYSLKVMLIEGPVTYEFARENPEVSRFIEISGDQNLKQLHEAIFRAFDRTAHREYEFQVDGAEHVEKTNLDTLHLSPGDIFYYWFDFSSDWMHLIQVVAIGDTVPGETYPTVIGKIGESPSQLPDWERVIQG